MKLSGLAAAAFLLCMASTLALEDFIFFSTFLLEVSLNWVHHSETVAGALGAPGAGGGGAVMSGKFTIRRNQARRKRVVWANEKMELAAK